MGGRKGPLAKEISQLRDALTLFYAFAMKKVCL